MSTHIRSFMNVYEATRKQERFSWQVGRAKRIWYLSPMRAAKVQASLRIRAVSPEPSLLAHTNSESRGTFRQKARSLAPLNGWACAVKIGHDGMLEDTNSLDGAQVISPLCLSSPWSLERFLFTGDLPWSLERFLFTGDLVLVHCCSPDFYWSMLIHVSLVMRKPLFGGLRPGKTQTSLLSYRS